MAQANKHVLRAALTYNLKKYMNFNSKNVQSGVTALQKGLNPCKNSFWIPFLAVLAILVPGIGNQTKNPSEILSTNTAQ
jgi:hypothetical protein